MHNDKIILFKVQTSDMFNQSLVAWIMHNVRILLISVFSALLFNILTTNVTAQENKYLSWDYVDRGRAAEDIQFDQQRRVWLIEKGSKSLLVMTPDLDESIDRIALSPLDPSGQFQILIAINDLSPAWLIDRQNRRGTHISMMNYIDNFVSWSPTKQYVVLHSYYEDINQVWVLDTENLKIREIHRKKLQPGTDECCGLHDWALREGELGAMDEESIIWKDANTFSFRLFTYCSPFDWVKSGPCAEAGDDSEELAAFIVTVDVISEKVSEQTALPKRK